MGPQKDWKGKTIKKDKVGYNDTKKNLVIDKNWIKNYVRRDKNYINTEVESVTDRESKKELKN